LFFLFEVSQTKLLTIVLLVTSIMISSVSIAIGTEHPIYGKYCNPSGCKGDEGYYTKDGHHHCFEGTKGCIESSYHKGS
jgi:hypothetical protein